MTARMKQEIAAALLAALVMMLTGCSAPKKITYMQGLGDGTTLSRDVRSGMTARSSDRLSIVVTSKDPALAEVFNMAVAQHRIGTAPGAAGAESGVSAFTVDREGNIEYPLLGSVHVAGLDRHEIASLISRRIVGDELLKDPVVTVEFLNATVSVLGDVAAPGEYPIVRDDMTILQAIAKAGDLQITGKRENVLVIRQEGDRDVAYRVDLTDPERLMASPAYGVRAGDVIYVEPNNMRKRQSAANGNNALNPSFWLSVVSVLTTVCVLLFK